MMQTTDVRTPNGAVITGKQYVARVRQLSDPFPCTHGHYDCAAWDRGPCLDEIQSALDAQPSLAADLSNVRPRSKGRAAIRRSLERDRRAAQVEQLKINADTWVVKIFVRGLLRATAQEATLDAATAKAWSRSGLSHPPQS